MDNEDERKHGIQSVEIGMQLLNTLVAHAVDNPPPMLKTLAAKANMPPAKAHRYMVSLVRAGLAERDPATDRYRLGPMARHMGIRALQGVNVFRLVSPRLEEISARLKQSVALSIWSASGPVIVATQDYRSTVTVGTHIGEVMPLLSSATGLAFCAWAPFKVEELLQKEIASNRSKGLQPSTMTEVKAVLERIREAGVGWVEGGLIPTVNAISAPVFDFKREMVAAIAVLGPSERLSPDPASEVAVKVKAIAEGFSRELGFDPALE